MGSFREYLGSDFYAIGSVLRASWQRLGSILGALLPERSHRGTKHNLGVGIPKIRSQEGAFKKHAPKGASRILPCNVALEAIWSLNVYLFSLRTLILCMPYFDVILLFVPLQVI